MMVRQAIVTKFIPCTNFRPSRVKATAAAGSITLSWEHALNGDGNHARAAEALAVKFGWKGSWYQGSISGSGDQCFVQVDDREPEPVFRTGGL